MSLSSTPTTPCRVPLRHPAAQLWHGDALQVLDLLPAASFHAVICDPPYALNFGGHRWDDPRTLRATTGAPHGAPASDLDAFAAWCAQWAAQCRRLLLPGGWLIAFGGTRTWHHLALGIERAGLTIRDQIAWLYTSGLVKNLDLSAALDRQLGATRPDRTVTTAPVQGAVLGRTRKVHHKGTPVTTQAQRWQGWGSALQPAFEPVVVARAPLDGTLTHTVLTHGSGGMHIDAGRTGGGRWPKNVALDPVQGDALDAQGADRSGMFPVFRHESKPGRRERPVVDGVAHPTVKPLTLMRWLCRLFVPADGLVLDPFAGSGATLEAALLEGLRVVGIERERDYLPLVAARVARAAAQSQPQV